MCVLGGRKVCTSCVWLQNQFCSCVTPYSNPTPLHPTPCTVGHTHSHSLPIRPLGQLSHKERWFTLSLPEGLFAESLVCVQNGYYTLHPTPYTLHPTPYMYTLHPAPWAIRTLPLSTHSSSRKERWFTLSLSEGLFAQSFVCVQSGYYTLHPTPCTVGHTHSHSLPIRPLAKSVGSPCLCLKVCSLRHSFVFKVGTTPYTLHPTPYTLHPTPYR